MGPPPAARLLVGALALLPHVGSGMWTSGSVVLRPNSTTFLSKFCFSFNPNETDRHKAGLVDFYARAPKITEEREAQLVLFDDEADSYTGPSSAWRELACEERLQHGKQFMYFDASLLQQPEGQEVHFVVKQQVKPRWWYFAIVDCAGPGASDLVVEWSLRVENPMYGALSELSTDRRFMLHLLIPVAMAYTALVLAQSAARRALRSSAGDDNASNKAKHPFARLLFAGLGLGLAETLLFSLHTTVYVFNGRGVPVLAILAQFLTTTSNFVLASLLLLVSEGKCVSYMMVAGDVTRMFRFLAPFLVSCCALELWGEYAASQNYTTDYVYTTPFGWALILVDLVLLGTYARKLYSTHLSERDRGDGVFYRTWGVLFGVWFLALPVTAILAQCVLAPYMWLIVSSAVKKGTTVFAYTSLVVGLWPGNARTYFKLDLLSSGTATRSTDIRQPAARKKLMLPAGRGAKLLPNGREYTGLLGSPTAGGGCASPWRGRRVLTRLVPGLSP